MTERTLTSETTGPVTIDAHLTSGGPVTVRADAGCDRATLTIRTVDEQGPAADAVRNATLRQSGTTRRAGVRDVGGGTTIVSGGITQIASGNHGATIVQCAGTVYGSMTGVTILNGQVAGGGPATVVQGSSPIEIIAVVPEGSSLEACTVSAGIDTHGPLANISAETTSGRIHLDRTDVATCQTVSGRIMIDDFGGTARLETVSGRVTVYATAGGDLRITTVSGRIDVTASDAATADDLNVQTSSVSGRINVPPQRVPGRVRRRRG